MLDALASALESPSQEILAAIIGAFVTVAVATIGAMLVIWQIGKEARWAIDQNVKAAALKMKLHAGEEIIRLCREAQEAEISLVSFVRGFRSGLDLYTVFKKDGHQPQVPEARVPRLQVLFGNLSEKMIELIFFTERWEIIDARLDLIRLSVNVSMHDLRAAFAIYHRGCFEVMPHDLPNQPGALFPWEPPSQETAEKFAAAEEQFLSAIGMAGNCISDTQVELQNLFLGGLFAARRPRRQPIDPSQFVVRLDQYSSLKSYYLNKTAWGREKQRIEADVRAAYSQEKQAGRLRLWERLGIRARAQHE